MRGSEIVEKLRGNGKKATPEPKPAPAPAPTPRAKSDGKLPPDFPCYYDKTKKAFWAKDRLGEWTEHSEAQLSRLLRSVGVKKDEYTVEGLHLVEQAILTIMHEKNVHYAGEVAGYPVGMYEISGRRVLITRGPKLVKPQEGPFPTIRGFLDSLLGEERRYFDAWCKSALLSLKAGSPFRPGQVLCLAGSTGCGKSLLQDLVTEILGGRSAKPYRYLIGETTFNGDLIQAEHLCIEDEPASVDLRTRRHFAQAIKGLCANRIQSFHPKGKDAMTVPPFWRVTISVNDDQEHLMVLPPLDDSLADKVILLRAKQAKFPYGPEDLGGRQQYRKKLSDELPGYLYWLRNWKLPASFQDQRFGCTAYQNEELKSMLSDLEPEHKLWTLIRALNVVPFGHVGWSGEASKLDVLLRNADRSGAVEKLLRYNTACAVYLERLSRLYPQNVIKKGAGGRKTQWQIILPDEEDF